MKQRLYKISKILVVMLFGIPWIACIMLQKDGTIIESKEASVAKVHEIYTVAATLKRESKEESTEAETTEEETSEEEITEEITEIETMFETAVGTEATPPPTPQSVGPAAPQPVEPPPAAPAAGRSLGQFRITHYCGCTKCCGKWGTDDPNGLVGGSSGAELIPGYSIAVDPNIIPMGSKVIINGMTYIAHDTGVSGNQIDIYLKTHQEAINAGLYYAEVFMP